MRVLVVEDDESLRATLAIGLRAAGFEVVTVGLARDGAKEFGMHGCLSAKRPEITVEWHASARSATAWGRRP